MEFNYEMCSSSELNGINKFKKHQANILFKNIENNLDIMVDAAKSGDLRCYEKMSYENRFIFDIMNEIDIYSNSEKTLLLKLYNKFISALNNNYFVEKFD